MISDYCTEYPDSALKKKLKQLLQVPTGYDNELCYKIKTFWFSRPPISTYTLQSNSGPPPPLEFTVSQKKGKEIVTVVEQYWFIAVPVPTLETFRFRFRIQTILTVFLQNNFFYKISPFDVKSRTRYCFFRKLASHFWLCIPFMMDPDPNPCSETGRHFGSGSATAKAQRFRFHIPEDVSHVLCVGGECVLRSQDLLRDGVQHRLDGQRGEVAVDHNTIHLWICKEENMRINIFKKENTNL